MQSVDPPMSAIESVSSARRPMRSPTRPSTRLPIGPRREAEREDREGQQLLRARARLRKELAADVAREVAVDREIEPLEDVADQAGERGATSGLGRAGGGFGDGVGIRSQITHYGLAPASPRGEGALI